MNGEIITIARGYYPIVDLNSKERIILLKKIWVQAKAIRQCERCGIDTLFSVYIHHDK